MKKEKRVYQIQRLESMKETKRKGDERDFYNKPKEKKGFQLRAIFCRNKD